MTMGHGTSQSGHTHFLSSLLARLIGMLLLLLVSNAQGARYVWKTGLWMGCQHHSCGEGGTQYRTVFCAEAGEYNFNTQDDSKCSSQRKPVDRRECFRVCDMHQNELRWAATMWSDCVLNPEFRVCSIKNGIRYRNVTCVWRQTGKIEDDRVCSEFEPKPDLQEQCDLKCPQDCIVTSFSKWSESNCDTCLIVNKTRTRDLVVPPDPSRAGKPCPPFTEMIPCENCSSTFTYRIGPWEECIVLDGDLRGTGQVHPILGYQKRKIHCINSVGNVVSYLNCVEYFRSTFTEITHTQTCIIPQDCIVSDWSNWSPHNDSCVLPNGTWQQGYMVKTRSVEQVQLGSGKPCPALIHYFTIDPDNEVPCFSMIGSDDGIKPMTHWRMTGWSECRVPDGSYSCTVGLQTRRAICVQEYDAGKERPVPDNHCEERRPLTSQTCRALCDLDCAVSKWSTWSECKVTDCELYMRRKRTNQGTGQRYRTREVLALPHGGGIICPHIDETQTCDPQPCYRWNITTGQCHLLNPTISPTCGLGIAYRTLSCINKKGFTVDNSLCEEISETPDLKQDCTIPCPEDCILSPWSPWSPCRGLCQEGKSTPAVQTRERSILAQSGVGGKGCPTNRELTEVRICPTTIECAIYVWRAEPWGACMLNESRTECGRGVQTREVSCYNLSGQPVTDQRCTFKVRPSLTIDCQVPCPIDCEVTEFSDWSLCSASCWEARQTVPIQTRVRHILQEPRFDGRACPSKLIEVRRCNNYTLCTGFYWHLGNWSACTLPADKIPLCGIGLQARDISCRQHNGSLKALDECIRRLGPLPDVTKTCYKSCDEECSLTQWSEWSLCISGCDGSRFRTREVIVDEMRPTSSVCQDPRFYPVYWLEKCLCETHQPIAIGNWSECILEPEYSRSSSPFQEYNKEESLEALPPTQVSRGYGVASICGQGLSYQVLACQNDKGEVEAANQCSLRPHKEHRCLITCPVDCVMSDWSAWTDCSTSCGTGVQMRYRHVKQNPAEGGRLCPTIDSGGKETQTRICTMECVMFGWRTYRWDLCLPATYGSVCGNGTQSRRVRCEEHSDIGFTGDEPVDEFMCIDQYRPPIRRPCYSPCVGECVVTEWSEWSMCKQPCVDPNQVQHRIRSVLRRPNGNPIYTCPLLREERFCIRGENCLEYSWVMTEWTTCLINNGSDTCGVGHRERYPICEDHNGRVVQNSVCFKALGQWEEQTVMTCEIACDLDCLLTSWSPWNDCSATCDLGEQVRTRDIVEKPRGNGRKCPPELEQHKPCFLRGCYQWFVSDWSECTNHKGVCGYGVQTRNITCMSSSGLQVNDSNCDPDLDVIILSNERRCRIPCPGECVMSDWTEWNACFIHCKDFERPRYTRGVQSRSQAVLAYAQENNPPCPDQLWESRPCEASHCFTFDWQTSEWNAQQTRHVWCERSDGLAVTGGCSEHSLPETRLSCQPACNIPGSYCNDTNTCVCKPRHKPGYNRLHVLVECIRMDNTTIASPVPNSVTLPTLD
ncbi:thrombospondin type-1 domain-containing protein 7A-like [Mya arenaria]|uniref:thrombospondin type-1 domain-containing protein 7A-like n=1 Tax=Mya arenaria TaxID=6604 RepID=UPI0022E86761|nr:thrombospondin type-1 domain-containing protein 7A-like [Mya arenaria]